MAGSPLWPRLLRVAAVTVLAGTLSGCWEGTTRGVLATVLAVEGSAAISSKVRERLVPLAPNARAGQGEIIELPGSARAAVSLLPNVLVQLDRNARLEIIRLAITKNGNETGASMQARSAEVRLIKGRMFVSQGWGEAIAKLSIITPQGELVTTSNALFCVESDEQKTRVTCVSGSVDFQVRKGEDATPIPPGFVWEGSSSGTALAAAETDARGQADLQEGLEVEEKLRALSSQNRLVLPR